MSKLGDLSDRALDLVEQLGDKVKLGSSSAGKVLQTSAALGVMRTGGKVAVGFARRNPAVAIAAGVGVGLLALAAYRKRKRDQMLGSTEGTPRRIDARRVQGTGKKNPTRRAAVIDGEATKASAED